MSQQAEAGQCSLWGPGQEAGSSGFYVSLFPLNCLVGWATIKPLSLIFLTSMGIIDNSKNGWED